MALRAQGLLGRSDRPADVTGVLGALGALQLDTISVLARSHELVCYARLGPVGRRAVEQAVWGSDDAGGAPSPGNPQSFPQAWEYWAHAACILPVRTWPWFEFRRRHYRRVNRWQLRTSPDALAEVRRRLEKEGPLTAGELGGAKQGGPWWDWSPIKVAAELLLDWGEVVCVTRRGWRRVYDLTERALPAALTGADPLSDAACLAQLVGEAGARLGVGTIRDLADYYRLGVADVERVVADSGLLPVRVEGWSPPAWAHPGALDRLAQKGRHRTTLLSPFDSLIWDRARTARLFGFTHRLEAYTPAARRVHGYYAMPVLAGGQLVGRVDPARSGRTLVAKRISAPRPGDLGAVAAALNEAAAWVGCDHVVVDEVDPPALGAALARLLDR